VRGGGGFTRTWKCFRTKRGRERGREGTDLVVEGEAVVGVFDELVNGEGGVVGLDDRVRHLGGREGGRE